MALVLLLLFVALFVGLFALGTGWFQSGEGRVMRDRLVALAQAAQRGPREDLALLRDEWCPHPMMGHFHGRSKKLLMPTRYENRERSSFLVRSDL